jgi:pimeloyl-ACP methyl ester carboxylesterase
MDVDIDELRKDTNGIDHLGIAEILDSYDAIVRELERPPIIMGHSFGGAFTEILIDRGLGAAGVAIDAAPVRGYKASILDAAVGLPDPEKPDQQTSRRAADARRVQYAFTNTMSEEESKAAWERSACPGRVASYGKGRSRTSTPHALKLDFKNENQRCCRSRGSDHVVRPPWMTGIRL